MPVTHLEVETTFDVAADLELPDLSQVPGVAAVVRVPTERLVATYYDTEDLRLLRSRVTLRRRTGGGDAGWHVKLPASGGRLEVRLPLERQVTRVPADLLSLTRSIARRDELRVIARLTTWRRVDRLLDDEGRVLAEVSLDDVVADALPGGARQEWRELEVELVDGEPPVLEAVAALLGRAGARPADVQSKIARALGDPLSQVPRPRPAGEQSADGPGEGTAGAVAAAYCREQVEELFRVDPHVRLDTDDAVHRMRVAARRLRSALATFRPVLDRAATDSLREELRWLGQALGAARDLEVLRERLRLRLRRLGEHDPSLVRGPVAEHLSAELDRRHEAALAEARIALDSDRYLDLLDRLDELCASPPFTERAHRRARPVLRHRLVADCKRVVERARVADELEGGAHEEALHEVRKAAKRARYAAEALEPVLGEETARVASRMKRLQEVLGVRQDQAVARALLGEVAGEVHDAGGDTFTYGVLAGLESADVDHAAYGEALRRARKAAAKV